MFHQTDEKLTNCAKQSTPPMGELVTSQQWPTRQQMSVYGFRRKSTQTEQNRTENIGGNESQHCFKVAIGSRDPANAAAAAACAASAHQILTQATTNTTTAAAAALLQKGKKLSNQSECRQSNWLQRRWSAVADAVSESLQQQQKYSIGSINEQWAVSQSVSQPASHRSVNVHVSVFLSFFPSAELSSVVLCCL